MMVKGILMFAVLLGKAWASIHGKTVPIPGKYDFLNNTRLSSKPYHKIDEFHCHLKPLTVNVSKTVVNVEEWQKENDISVSYKVEVHWIQKNAIVSNAIFDVAMLNEIQLPVLDQCSIQKLKVCRMHRLRSFSCFCGNWNPQNSKVSNIQIIKQSTVHILTWAMEYPACIRYYEISMGSSVVPLKEPFIGMTGLEPLKRYRVILKIYHQNEKIDQRLFEIHPLPDPAISNPSRCDLQFFVQNRDATDGLVTANHEKFKIFRIDGDNATTNGIVCSSKINQTYATSVKSSLVDNKQWPKENSVKLTNLSSKVFASIQVSCPGNRPSLVDSTIRPSPVGPVRELRANTDYDRSVLLTWKAPKEGIECVKGYLITWSSKSETVDTKKTSYNVTDLEPCTKYEFTINAIDLNNDKGIAESITATVRELQQLSEVTELELNEVEPRSLSLKWKPPVDGTFCVESYRVVAWYNSSETNTWHNSPDVEVFSNTTTNQHVTFGEVIACMVYTVQVIPISISNNDGLKEQGTVRTKERTILSYHVEPIRVITTNARSLELSTMLHSENNNNCLLVSVAFHCIKTIEEDESDPESLVIKEFVIPNSKSSFEGIVEPLVPYTWYSCKARIQNIAGWSDPTQTYDFQTAEDVPGTLNVIELIAKNRSNGIVWKAPTVKNGIVVRYRIHVRMIASEYPQPKLCTPLEEFNETVDLRDEVNPDEIRSWDGIEFEHVVTKLNPYTLYMVQVAAATGAGFGPYTEPIQVVTLPDVSNAVENFRIETIIGPELDQPYQSSIEFSWDLPCGLNGRLKRFVGQMYGIRDQDPSTAHSLFWDVNVTADEEIQDSYSYIENRLKPEYNYTVSIRVEVVDVNELSNEANVQFESPAEIPTIDHKVEWFNVDVFKAPNPTYTARIMLGNMTLPILLTAQESKIGPMYQIGPKQTKSPVWSSTNRQQSSGTQFHIWSAGPREILSPMPSSISWGMKSVKKDKSFVMGL